MIRDAASIARAVTERGRGGDDTEQARRAVESKSSCDWWSEATSGSVKDYKLWEKREGKALGCLQNEMAEAVEEAEEQDMRGL